MPDGRRRPAGGTFKRRRLQASATVAKDAADRGSPKLHPGTCAQRCADDDLVVSRAHVSDLVVRGDLGFRAGAGFIRPPRLGGPAANVAVTEGNEPLDRVAAPLVHQAASEKMDEESRCRGASVHACAHSYRLLLIADGSSGRCASPDTGRRPGHGQARPFGGVRSRIRRNDVWR